MKKLYNLQFVTIFKLTILLFFFVLVHKVSFASGGGSGTAPANDPICSAVTIACGQSINGTTVNATNSGNGENTTCNVSQGQGGVWYKFVGSGQVATVSLCATTWDSKVSVFSGASCSGALTCVGGNDDNGPACNSTAASFSWYAATGTTYYILVHGFSSNSAFTINLTCCTPPAQVSFGNNTWNVLGYRHNAYNFANLSTLAGNTYMGYYTDPTVDINSQLRWNTNNSPSSAAGWTGCTVPNDLHTTVYKRQGFPSAYYLIDLNGHDDGVQCYVNGTLVYSIDACCADRGVIWQGALCATSTVEFRVMEGTGGSNLNVDFIESTWNVNAGPDLTVCSGAPSVLAGISKTNVTYNGVSNIAIPDPGTVSTSIVVSGTTLNANQIAGVLINAAHTYDMDLSFTLIAPNGSSIDLSSNNGGGGDNYTNTYFSTTGASITTGTAPFTGTYTPEVAFTNLTGSANGTWTLTINDNASVDVGTLNNWSLTFNNINVGTYAWSSNPAGFTSTLLTPTVSPTVTTTYTLTASANGCSLSDAAIVNVNALPTVTASASATTICEGQSVTVNGGGASTYSWNNGATNNVPTFPTSTTTYTVTGTAANTCTSTANVTVNVNNTADFANLQSPQNATVNCGSNTTVYGKIYDAALTPAAGANGTISVQVGVSTTNTDPSTWAAGAWTTATFNQQYLNDDEYMALIGSTLAPGTYYYAFRYQIGSTGCYRYGGYSASNGGFWNGTTNVNGTLTVNGSTIDWANIQFPTSGSVCSGSNYTVYGQVYEAGVTNPAGAASGLIAELGVSSTNTDPSTWAAGAWSAASFNTQSGNNDEFFASIGSSLTPGTYYYAFRYKLASACNYQYGGTNGFYNGTSNMNGVLVVTASPAATLTTASSAICNGNEVTLSGSVTATGAWTLNLSNGQTATGTGNGTWNITTIPTATTTYSISSLTTSGCAANLSGTSTITVPTGTALSGNNESATCMVNQSGWIHFYTSGASPKLIASINSQGQNLGNVTVTSYVDPSSALVPACSNPSAMYATNVLQRHWVITPTTQPTAPVLIRLPHTNAEYTTLSGVASTNQNQNDNIIVPQDLDLTKYSNSLTPGLVDDNALNNCGSGTSSFHQQTNYGYTNTYSGVNENYAEFSIPGFSEFWLHGSAQASPLPVELVSFQANCAGEGKVNVTWATASEHNSANFTVEKSRDGMNWTVMASLAGAGNSTQMINYSTVDNNAAAGVNYYRLTQTDFDGASETFNIASVNCGDNSPLTTVKVYPNPSAGDFYIDFTSEEITGSSVITITDARGMEVYKMNVTVEKGSNVFHIDNMEAAPGMYYIQVSNGTNTSNIVKHSLR